MTGAGWLGRLLGRPGSLIAALVPEGMLWAVGDVHGRLDLYRAVEARIARAARDEGRTQTVVLLGDMIDRGPESRGMIEHLLAPPPEGLRRHALRGNHEDMALRFLAKPGAHAAWLDFGGLETLASYGVSPGEGAPDLPGIADAFRAALPEAHLGFLRGLPAGLHAGRWVLTHAGAAPETPLSRQTSGDLTWARHAAIPDLLPPADLGGRTVVHGHVPVSEPIAQGWRINVDTGACFTGRLTAVRLPAEGDPAFLTVTEGA